MRTTNRYLDFLCKIVGKEYQYSALLEILHNIEFYSLVPYDDNRAADGEHLRQQYLSSGALHRVSDLPEYGCSVLEMMIGLAQRLEYEAVGGRWERSTGEWFWVLIDNLGLEWDDNCAISDTGLAQVAQIVENLLERRYSASGDGGLFPLRNPKKDQRTVEIWYQMSEWISENYPI